MSTLEGPDLDEPQGRRPRLRRVVIEEQRVFDEHGLIEERRPAVVAQTPGLQGDRNPTRSLAALPKHPDRQRSLCGASAH